MTRAFTNRENIKPSCRKCNEKYDLGRAVNVSERRRTRTLHCPKCNAEVGKL